MRLKKIWISHYKNLKNFSLDLDGKSFLDIFVGKNGSGKSNLLEGIVEVFNFLYQYKDGEVIAFDFKVVLEINSNDVSIEYNSGKVKINENDVKKVDAGFLPEKVILYYSGHNGSVANIVDKYENSFQGKIKTADISESRTVVSIGNEYKEILLSVLLLQSESNRARSYILDKLTLKEVGPYLRLILRRPYYAKTAAFDVVVGEDNSRYWQAKGIVKEFLDKLINCRHQPTDGKLRDEGYIASRDQYAFYLDIEKIRTEFKNYNCHSFFNLFDNLKTLGMLESIIIPIQRNDKDQANISYFSDGQFQSIYMYAITEIFKGVNCLTLLDEPDAFLHPEWQFSFISHVSDIAEDTAKTNHIIMSSHSASTLAKAEENTIRLFNFDGIEVKTSQVSKSKIIDSLSAGLISFSEGEAQLSITHVLKNTSGPVLFTEGITDEIILETAWKKLYPSQERKFVIQNAFDRSFLQTLFQREELKNKYGNRKMFALFDFDEGFDNWNSLKASSHLITDPHLGLAKKLLFPKHYALLLPVPKIELIRQQVLKRDGTPWKGVDCHLSLELLFYSDDLLDKHFRKEPASGGGEIVQFYGDKTRFANDVVPTFPENKFSIFKSIFEFVVAESGLA